MPPIPDKQSRRAHPDGGPPSLVRPRQEPVHSSSHCARSRDHDTHHLPAISKQRSPSAGTGTPLPGRAERRDLLLVQPGRGVPATLGDMPRRIPSSTSCSLHRGQSMAPDVPRPARVWLLSQLAARFGGEPEDYSQVFYVLFLLCHGAATILATEGDAALHEEIRENCLRVCNKAIENVEMFRSHPAGLDWSGS